MVKLKTLLFSCVFEIHNAMLDFFFPTACWFWNPIRVVTTVNMRLESMFFELATV